MKRFAILALVLVPFLAQAKNTALATHHTIKAGKGLTKVAHVTAKISVGTVIGVFDVAEAAVDSFGVALQGFADAVDISVAAPLEAVPPPVHYLGVAVHGLYLGIDKVGQVLAE